MEVDMTAITTPVPPDGAAVPVWTWAVLAAAVAVLWAVAFEGGVLSQALAGTGSFLHELFHDGRHLVGVPCH
jgi:hypothetical protein